MNNKKKKQKNEDLPLRLWLVELTLTSGEVRTFYVKALYQFEAYAKADYYVSLVENEKLFDSATKKFKLLP
jgi:hypothetical protein